MRPFTLRNYLFIIAVVCSVPGVAGMQSKIPRRLVHNILLFQSPSRLHVERTIFGGPSSVIMSRVVVATNNKVVVKPDRRDEFIAVLQQVQKSSLQDEPGILCYAWGHDVNDRNSFYFHEQYRTLQDYEKHKTSPHYETLMEFAKTDPLVSLTIKQFEGTHEPKAHGSDDLVNPSFRLNVESFLKPEFREEFLQLMKTHQASSFAELGCVQFDWGESMTEPNTFYMHEQYKTKVDYDFHETTPHFAKFGMFNAKDPYTKPQVVDYFVVPVQSLE
jgi:quinol monooxygenase YgiN